MTNPHAFSLNGLHKKCHYQSINVDFTCPPIMEKKLGSVLPVFLNDRHYFTPCFVLAGDQKNYQHTLEEDREKFDARILRAHQQYLEINQQPSQSQPLNNQFQLPIPSTKFCQICQKSFSSYPHHVKETPHLRQFRFSKANIYIRQLCKKYKKQTAKKTVKPARKSERIENMIREKQRADEDRRINGLSIKQDREMVKKVIKEGRKSKKIEKKGKTQQGANQMEEERVEGTRDRGRSAKRAGKVQGVVGKCQNVCENGTAIVAGRK